jgi:hypothetical protein
MIVDAVRSLLQEAGLDADAVLWAAVSDQPPRVPSHRWVVWPTTDDEIVLGGSDHGRFAAYARFGDPTLVAEILARWLEPDLPPAPRDRATLHAASLSVADMLVGPDAVAELSQDGFLPGSVVPVGAPLDHIGNASGHVLHLYDTAFAARSLPPTDANEPRTGFVLEATLPDACRVVRVEPWFGQPGGGVSIVLDRVIAYYVDRGVLSPFAVEPDGEPAETTA